MMLIVKKNEGIITETALFVLFFVRATPCSNRLSGLEAALSVKIYNFTATKCRCSDTGLVTKRRLW